MGSKSKKKRKDVLSLCSNALQEILSDNDYLLLEPLESEDKRSHAVYAYLKKIFHPRDIVMNDKTYFLINPEGDVELYYDYGIRDFKNMLDLNMRFMEL